FNWKTFIEVYLEDYHVWAFHPGLNNIVNCDDLTWEFKSFSSIQKVPFREKDHSKSSPIYDHWKSKINEQSGDSKPPFGAIWLTIYPFFMIEWYPNVIVVSHLIPDDADHCRNIIEFYYPEETILFDQDYIDAQQAAYNETALLIKTILTRNKPLTTKQRLKTKSYVKKCMKEDVYSIKTKKKIWAHITNHWKMV
ncbi:MAG: hypothetical protein RIT47_882, partial [Pseudomonadota bacterium]